MIPALYQIYIQKNFLTHPKRLNKQINGSEETALIDKFQIILPPPGDGTSFSLHPTLANSQVLGDR